MQRRKFVTVLSVNCLILALVALPLVAACAKPTPAPALPPAPKPEPIVLKVVSFLPRTDPTVRNLLEFVEEMPKRSNGRIIIKYRGGPEAIPAPQQPKAAKEGVVDIAFTLTGFCKPLGIPPLQPVSPLTPDEEHKPGGFADQMQEFYSKAGLYYLGRTDARPQGFFYNSTNKRVKKPHDLAGQKV